MLPRFTYPVRVIVLSICCLCCAVLVHAQGLSISGRVVDETGLAMPSATVFLGGTMRITATDLDGKFNFGELAAGSYIVTVKMIGYTPYFKNVTIKQSLQGFIIEMKPSPTALREVKISAHDKEWSSKYALFKECFLGITKNGRRCKIINPTVLRLWYEDNKRILKGSSDDFLIVENPELGYRVKYLIKRFEYDGSVGTTNYDGETSFEELTGTTAQKAKWMQNRRIAYYGSAMHFFRALYLNKRTPVSEGFMVRGVTSKYDLSKEDINERLRPPVDIDPRPVRFDTIVHVVDSSFIAISFTRDLFIKHQKKRGPLEMLSISEGGGTGEVAFSNEASIIQLSGGEAIIDSRGKIAGEMPFLMLGRWGHMRIGDQLPYEYRP